MAFQGLHAIFCNRTRLIMHLKGKSKVKKVKFSTAALYYHVIVLFFI